MITTTFAGFNMIYYSAKEALGEEVNLENIKIKNGIEFKRYWDGIGLDEENFIGRIKKILKEKYFFHFHTTYTDGLEVM